MKPGSGSPNYILTGTGKKSEDKKLSFKTTSACNVLEDNWTSNLYYDLFVH